MSRDCSAQVAPAVTNVLLEIKQQLAKLRAKRVTEVKLRPEMGLDVQEPFLLAKLFSMPRHVLVLVLVLRNESRICITVIFFVT
jgi:hypothetical protein